jgi:flagellar hook assembly protein FlgD
MQISSLEQARAMQSDLAAMRHEQQVIQANSMLGREVNFGETIDGKVSAVKFQDGRPMIEVDGQLYDLEQLLSINLPAENVMPTEGYRNIINPMIKQVQHDA